MLTNLLYTHCKSYQKARIWNLLKWLANMMNYLKQIIIWYFLTLKRPLNKEYLVYEVC